MIGNLNSKEKSKFCYNCYPFFIQQRYGRFFRWAKHLTLNLVFLRFDQTKTVSNFDFFSYIVRWISRLRWLTLLSKECDWTGQVCAPNNSTVYSSNVGTIRPICGPRLLRFSNISIRTTITSRIKQTNKKELIKFSSLVFFSSSFHFVFRILLLLFY